MQDVSLITIYKDKEKNLFYHIVFGATGHIFEIIYLI